VSVEFNVYLLGRHPEQGPVGEGLEPLGLAVTFLSSWDTLTVQKPPRIVSGAVVGYQSTDTSEVSSLLEARDKASLEALYADERLALVLLDLDSAFAYSPEFEAELEDAQVASSIRKALRGSRAVVTLRTAAKANDFSLEFQRSLWASIGITCGGVLEDPEESEFTDASKV